MAIYHKNCIIFHLDRRCLIRSFDRMDMYTNNSLTFRLMLDCCCWHSVCMTARLIRFLSPFRIFLGFFFVFWMFLFWLVISAFFAFSLLFPSCFPFFCLFQSISFSLFFSNFLSFSVFSSLFPSFLS